MARYTHIDNYNARDTVTGDWLDVIARSVWYEHLRKNLLAAMIDGSLCLFTPQEHLADVTDSDDEFSDTRRLVIERRRSETGHTSPVVVAVQATRDSDEYVDCIIDNLT